MKDFKVPEREILSRKEKMQQELRKSEIEGVLISQRVDLFYFSGTAQTGHLYMPSEGEPLLFIKKYLPRAARETPLKRLTEIDSLKDIPGLVTDYYGRLPRVMGLEFDVLPVRSFNYLKTIFPVRQFVDASPTIMQARMIKSAWEIEQMERAALLSRKIFRYAEEAIRPGFTELEFAGMMETFARRHGHGVQLRIRDYQTYAFPGHILSGKSGGIVGALDAPASGSGTSVAFPGGPGYKRLAVNEPIMIDFGTVMNGYHLDETRFFAIGSLPKSAERACRASIEIHDKVMERAKPGTPLEELFQFSVDLARDLGYAEQYLGPPGYKTTFVAHGIGLELVEAPFIAKGKKDILETGMTFALEPKMVFSGRFSAGIESVFTVTEKGGRLVSRVPVDIFVV